MQDRELTSRLISATAARASAALRRPRPPSDLPHPLVTDALFRDHLDRAAAHQGAIGDPDGPGSALSATLDRASRAMAKAKRLVGAPATRPADQVRFNDSIVHTLHQLDHRTRQQAETIAYLEAELLVTKRALDDARSAFAQ